MKTLEEFFKNRVLFTANSHQPVPTFFSENIYNPEDYSLDFLKEKTKSICYYLYSAFDMVFFNVEIYLQEVGNGGINFEEIEDCIDITIQSKKIITIGHALFFYECFLWKIDYCFKKEKKIFCHKIPTKPFRIMIIPTYSSLNSDNEEENKVKQINTNKSFKSNECVICLTNPPNVLFSNCGHICICIECDKRFRCLSSLQNENYIKRMIE